MDCREWNRTDKAQKTWVNFKLHFSQAFRENRDQSRQAQHAGYGHSNNQNSANAVMLAEMTQYHSHALANLATATQSDCTTVANMSKTIADLTLQLGQANMKLAEAQSSIATITSKLAKIGTRPNRSTTSPAGPSDRLEKYGYCWSHGFKITKGHSSRNCENQKSGHRTAATRDNTMGGKLYNKGWDKWRSVFDKLVNKHINVIETTNTITHKHVDNLATADYGTSGHFLKSNSPCVDKIIATNQLGIRMPDGHTIYSSNTALLPQDTLPIKALHAHIFPDLKKQGTPLNRHVLRQRILSALWW